MARAASRFDAGEEGFETAERVTEKALEVHHDGEVFRVPRSVVRDGDEYQRWQEDVTIEVEEWFARAKSACFDGCGRAAPGVGCTVDSELASVGALHGVSERGSEMMKSQAITVAELAADPVFDPDDYGRSGSTGTFEVSRCGVPGCAVRRVPSSRVSNGRAAVCGYCRARVKALRASGGGNRE